MISDSQYPWFATAFGVCDTQREKKEDIMSTLPLDLTSKTLLAPAGITCYVNESMKENSADVHNSTSTSGVSDSCFKFGDPKASSHEASPCVRLSTLAESHLTSKVALNQISCSLSHSEKMETPASQEPKVLLPSAYRGDLVNIEQKKRGELDQRDFWKIEHRVNPVTRRQNTIYICVFPGCNREFKKKWNYTEHFKSHSHAKPFECPECGKLFSQKGSLLKHIKSKSEGGRYHGLDKFRAIYTVDPSEL